MVEERGLNDKEIDNNLNNFTIYLQKIQISQKFVVNARLKRDIV